MTRRVRGGALALLLLAAACMPLRLWVPPSVSQGLAAPPAAAAEGGDQPALIFASSFLHATGTSTPAIGDNGKFDMLLGQGHEVIANPGFATLGFPDTIGNLMKVKAMAANDGFCFFRTTTLGTPATPFTRWFRCYFRLTSDWSINQDNDQHPVQDGHSFSNVNVCLSVNQSENTWLLEVEHGAQGRFLCDVVFQKHHTYRWEAMIEVVSSSEVHVYCRMYNESGTLITAYTNFDWLFELSSTPFTMADNPTSTAHDLTSTGIGGFAGGCNGLNGLQAGGVDMTNPPYAYQSAFAVSDEDWIGPHVSGEET